MPIYDFDILPAIQHPFISEQESTTKYLGNKAVSGQTYATLNIFITNNVEAKALYDFWKTDCNYGTLAFTIPIPIFGVPYDRSVPNTVVEFMEDITYNKEDIHWKQSVKIKVISETTNTVQSNVSFVVDDSIIPIYDFTLLPAIEHPFESKQEVTSKYLGKRALTGDEYSTLNIFMVDNSEAVELYKFWKTDCSYGTIPFLVALPFFGETYDRELPTTLVEFIDDISSNKEDINWKQSVQIKVIGEISYIVDDSLNYLVNDSGDYIISDTVLNLNKEITWQ